MQIRIPQNLTLINIKSKFNFKYLIINVLDAFFSIQGLWTTPNYTFRA
ncbi:MAG: hypothetical protein OJF59_001139 [Cytophagales bacterium]|nr:MAG: hypothetical protein OJF59_001139 [Cytophagales bacterium]